MAATSATVRKRTSPMLSAGVPGDPPALLRVPTCRGRRSAVVPPPAAVAPLLLDVLIRHRLSRARVAASASPPTSGTRTCSAETSGTAGTAASREWSVGGRVHRVTYV